MVLVAVALLCSTAVAAPAAPAARGAQVVEPPLVVEPATRSAGLGADHVAGSPAPAPARDGRACAGHTPCTPVAAVGASHHRRAVERWADALRTRRGREATGSSPAPDPACTAADLVLADFWTRYVDASSSRWRYVAGHPRDCVRAVRAVRRLAVVGTGRLPGHEGRMVADAVRAPAFLGVPIGRLGMAVLDVPTDAASYLLGPSRATVRRKVRAAAKDGTAFRPVRDPAERRALRLLADGFEQAHRDDRYRVEDPDNADLEDVDLWLVGESPEGVPLLLVVVPVAGSTAVLRYFRTLGAGPAHSNARYLGTAELVEELARRGVRHLVDPMPPGELTNGLRHFQRMVGFRYRRVVTG